MADISRLALALEGRYRIDREIGSGGMATVYVAYDQRHERQVAVKVMREELAATLGSARFVREIKLCARLQHTNILPVYDSGEADGFLYYVMPFVEGATLRHRLQADAPMPFEDVVRYVREIGDALDYAAEQGIVHRDIKPENVLLSRDHAVIMDFGIARAMSVAQQDQVTRPGLVMGTPTYMSPEQCEGREELDGRSDQYALGCMAYEMLTGRPPFVGDDVSAVLRQQIASLPVAVSDLRSDLPVRVSDVVRRALAKDRHVRYPSSREFAEALVGAGLRRPSGTGRAVALTAVVTLGLVGLFWWGQVGPGPRTAEPARLIVLPFENLGARNDEYVADGVTDAITTELMGIEGLSVISSQTAMTYKTTTFSVPEIADELDLQYVLSGTVQRELPADPQSRVRVVAQLTRTADHTGVWGDNFELDLVRLFAMYEQIAGTVADRLQLELDAAVPGGTENAEAYDAYLRAKDYFSRRVYEENARRAVEMFERAVAADTMFAEGFAGLAHAYAWYAWDFGGDDERDRARVAIDRALALDSLHWAVQLAAGYFDYYGRLDYAAALDRFERVRAQHPANAEVWEAVGLIRRRLGDWQSAAREFEGALNLNPRGYFAAFLLGQTLAGMRQDSLAEAALDRAIAIGPDVPDAYVEKAWLYLHMDGGTARAREVLRAAAARVDTAMLASAQMWLSLVEGDGDAAIGYSQFAPVAEGPLSGTWLVPAVTGGVADVALLDSARQIYENAVRARPSEPQLHSFLGGVYALLGREADAIGSGRTALTIRPDGFTGPTSRRNLAAIYALLARVDESIAHLDTLMQRPFRVTLPPLALDPTWRRIRGHPRFRELVNLP